MDIQRLLDNPGELLSQCLRKLAPRGWNTNTQFFLIFLAIFGLHLWLLPALMRSAGVKEPGDPQGYFTSGPGAAETNDTTSAPEAIVSAESPDAAPASADAAPEEKSGASELTEEALVLSDSPTVATPVEEKDKETGNAEEPTPSSPENPEEIVSAVNLASDPAADLLEDLPPTSARTSEPVADASSGQSAKERPQAQPLDRPEPKLSDLVTEAKSSKPEPTPGTGEGPRARSFRSLR